MEKQHEKLVKDGLLTAKMVEWKMQARGAFLHKVAIAQSQSLLVLVDEPAERIHVMAAMLASYAARIGCPLEDIHKALRVPYEANKAASSAKEQLAGIIQKP